MSRLSSLMLVLAVLAASGARAQGVVSATMPLTVRLNGDQSSNTYAFTASQCGSTLTLTWNYSGTLGSTFTTPLTLWTTSATSCASSPASTEWSTTVSSATVVLTRSGTFQLTVDDLPAFNVSDGDGGVTVPCGTDGVEVTQRVCGTISYNTSLYSSTATVQPADPLIITYDTKPPSAPTVTDAGALDQGAVLLFSADSTTVTVLSQYSPAGLDGGDQWVNGPSATVANGSRITLTGLTNNVTYDVRLIAADQASNYSDPSAVVQVLPQHTVGFFEAFRAAGGSDEGGGCAVAGGVPLLAAALALTRALARRRDS